MSDYSYCIVHDAPPPPCVDLWTRLRSWRRPVRGWTEGTATDWTGLRTCRQEWEIVKGRSRPVGILHTCGDTKTCSCVTERQLAPAALADPTEAGGGK